MFYRVRPEFVHGQADVLGCLRIQFQFGPLNENRIVTQVMEGSELGSPGAVPGLFFSWEAATILLPKETARDGTGCEAPGTSRAADHLWDMSSAPARGCRWHVPARPVPNGVAGALTRLIKETATQQVEFAGTTLNLVRSTGDQRVCGVALRMSERIVSDEFDGLDATEKAGIEAALNRCRALAAEIAREL